MSENDSFDLSKVDEILSRHELCEASLIPIMQEIQKEYSYLPEPCMEYIAQKIGITKANAYSVASFYEFFRFEKTGKHLIRICNGTSCHVRKSGPIVKAVNEKLGLDVSKKTSDDGLFTVETVACLGACGVGPNMKVDSKIMSGMTPEKAIDIIEMLQEREALKNDLTY